MGWAATWWERRQPDRSSSERAPEPRRSDLDARARRGKSRARRRRQRAGGGRGSDDGSARPGAAADGPDADTIATVDLGAFEAGASLGALTDRTITEDGVATVTFELSDPNLVTAVTVTSSNTALVPNNLANLSVTGLGATRTLTVTPTANAFGTADITVTVMAGAER